MAEEPPSLGDVLEQILEEKRRGGRPDLERLVREHPELAAELRDAFPALELLERARSRPIASPASIPAAGSSRSGDGPERPIATDSKPTAVLPDILQRLAGRAIFSARYQMKGEIGRGGQGAVYSVWDEDLRRDLAMKVTLGPSKKSPSASEQRSLGRFLDEAQVTAQLDHPGIVPVHELGVDTQGGVYFTMKLVKGRDLRRIFEQVQSGEEGWTRTRALNVMLKVCEAMAYAHSKGVIHRDLKPSNVMVGRYGEAYVMDWGLARMMGQEDHKDIRLQPGPATSELEIARREAELDLDSPLITMEGDVVGTPAYMSPEQARGEFEAMGPPSDVYSLGAMLYHLLAGHMPYALPGSRLTNRVILALVQRGPPDALQRLAPDAPGELVAISDKAMAREARARYADTGALAEDLRAFLENRVVAAYRTGALVELRKWVERNKALAGAIAAGVLVLTAGLAVSLFFKARSDSNATLAQENATRAQKQAEEATNQAAIAQAVTDFLTQDLLAAVGPVVQSQAQFYRGQGVDVSMREVLDQASRKIEEAAAEGGRFAEKPLVEAAIRMCLGDTFEILDDPKCFQHHERACRLLLEELGEEHPDTIEAMRKLGIEFGYQGRLEEAADLLERASEIARRVLGEKNRETHWCLSLLGGVKNDQGEVEEAERLWRSAFDGARKNLGEDDRLTLGMMPSLGGAARRLGRTTEAETWYVQCLELAEKALGADDLLTLNARAQLGNLYRSMGRLGEAEEQLRISWEGFKRAFPWLSTGINALAGLAEVLREQGRLEEARELTVQLLEQRAAHASKPAAPAMFKNAYARELLTCEPAELQDPEKALAFAREASELTGNSNASFLDTLALAYHRTGDTARAIETEKQALEVLPHGDSPLRERLEARLAEFEAAEAQAPGSK